MKFILETKRLILREMDFDDFDSLKKVLSDPNTMKYYPKPYDDEGVNKWIRWSMASYEKRGFGLWAVVLKETGEMIGDCGISMQTIDDELKPEIGYHLRRDYHRLGLGAEMTQAVKNYFFENFDFDEVYSYMNQNNLPSEKTAIKNGMTYLHLYKDKLGSIDKVYRITRDEWIMKKDYFDMEFHRGGRDSRPENTLYSYFYAIENGATTIECDMQLTKDNIIVMSHNPILNSDITVDEDGNRIENDKFFINKLTLKELKKYNVGVMDKKSSYYKLHGKTQVQVATTIPTLEELFTLVKETGADIRMNIETKTYPDKALGKLYQNNSNMEVMVNEFYKLVKKFGFQKRVMLQSFDWSTLLMIKKLDPEIETVALYCEEESWGKDSMTLWLNKKELSPWLAGINIHEFNDNPILAAHHLGIDDISPYFEELTPSDIKLAHKLNMKVIPWTVNKVEDMKKLYDMGVDGIISDKGWLLRSFLESVNAKIYDKRKIDSIYKLDIDHIEADDEIIKNGEDASC